MKSSDGFFITFEGIDGSGKSTQAKRLQMTLENMGIKVLRTREPGGSEGAEEIRKLLVEGDKSRWSAYSEMLLFFASRRDHIEKTILPALKKGMVVICDRFTDSTRVYQGATREDLSELVDELDDLVIKKQPDLTLIIDMDPMTSLKRGLKRNSKEDRFESFGIEFQQRLRAGYIKLSKKYTKRCNLIDGDQEEEQVANDISNLIIANFGKL